MRLRAAPFAISLFILLGVASFTRSQEQGYLSQKLLLENTIQQRVTSAISKILDESQFVVDVKVELTFSASRQVETAYRTPDGRLVPRGEPRTGVRRTEEMGVESGQTQRTVTSPFPIPGFPDVTTEEGEPIRALDEDEPSLLGEDVEGAAEPVLPESPVDETISEITGGLPNIKSMAVSIILEDGVTPQTIENVRQVALIASGFDRDRGDILSITTASFKDRRPSPGIAAAELPIAEGVRSGQAQELEAKLQKAQARNEELMRELRNRELEYLQRSEEERKQALADLAEVQNERAKDLIFLQQQREEQNTRLQEALLTQIDEMRKDLTSGRLSPEEEDILSIQTASLEDSLNAMRVAFETEKERLQAQIEAALTTREPPPSSGFGGLGSTGLLILIGAILLVAFIVIAIVLATTRGRAQAVPPGVMYPGHMPPPYPRRRKPAPRAAPPVMAKKKIVPKEVPAEEVKLKEEAPPSAPPDAAKIVAPEESVEIRETIPPEAREAVPTHVEEDPDVLRSEIKSIRQSIVSMSVGRPESATRIVSDWLEEKGKPEEPVVEEGSKPLEVDEAAGEEES